MRMKQLGLLCIMCAITLSGCGKSIKDYVKEKPAVSKEKVEINTEAISETEAVTETETEEGFTFADVKDWEFTFASGAGAWATILDIDEDGSFEGIYHDSDMGSTGEGYQYGTVYYCDFQGKFTKPEKVDEYTYKFQIEDISYANEVGTEEIIDQQLYVYTDAYGLENAKDFYMYLPGAPTAQFSEEILSWIHVFDYSENRAEEPELSFYVLCNMEQQEAFAGDYYSSEAENQIAEQQEEKTQEISQGGSPSQQVEAIVEKTKAETDVLEDKLENEPLSQLDMNWTSGEIYEKWDNTLNDIWKIMNESLPESKMSELKTEQKAWIKEKDKQVQAVYDEYEGGSIQSLMANSKGTELTKKRVYELIEYVK